MKVSIFAALIAVASSGLVHAAPDDAISLAFQIDRNEIQVAAPKLLVTPGNSSEIRRGDDLKLQVTAVEQDMQVFLDMKLHLKEGTDLVLVGSPKMSFKYGDAASMKWVTGTGTQYKIAVTAVRAKLPKHVAAAQ